MKRVDTPVGERPAWVRDGVARFRTLRAAALIRTKLGRRANLAQYRYSFSPAQLWALCDAAASTSRLGGALMEVGVAAGDTTVFLNRHLASLGVPLPPYYCLDTFEGFSPKDIEVERANGRLYDYGGWFRVNSPTLLDASLRLHGLEGSVRIIQADAATFDYGTLPRLAFALVDVDLYRPMRAALAGCWERLLPGGIMVADDCTETTTWAGAKQAFEQFCEEISHPLDIRCGKLGFVHKPPLVAERLTEA